MQSILEAVQMKSLKHRGDAAKHEGLREWLWHFTMHVGHGLAKVCSCSGAATPLTGRLHGAVIKRQRACAVVAAHRVL